MLNMLYFSLVRKHVLNKPLLLLIFLSQISLSLCEEQDSFFTISVTDDPVLIKTLFPYACAQIYNSVCSFSLSWLTLERYVTNSFGRALGG